MLTLLLDRDRAPSPLLFLFLTPATTVAVVVPVWILVLLLPAVFFAVALFGCCFLGLLLAWHSTVGLLPVDLFFAFSRSRRSPVLLATACLCCRKNTGVSTSIRKDTGLLSGLVFRRLVKLCWSLLLNLLPWRFFLFLFL